MPTVNFKTKLNEFLDASYPVLGIETFEESRILAEIRESVKDRKVLVTDAKGATKQSKSGYYEWDEAGGFRSIDLSQGGEVEQIPNCKEPNVALAKLATLDTPAVAVFKDLHPHLGKSPVWRVLRNVVGTLQEKGICVILLSPRLQVPPELSKEVQMVDYGMPGRQDLEESFGNYTEMNLKPRFPKIKLDDEFKAAVAEAAMGMTASEADNAFALATINSARRNDKKVELDQEFVRHIFEVKISNLKHTALEYIQTHAGFESVGGLENVKAWAMQRREGFSERARQLHLPYPKGVLLPGVKGCGKTTIAMAIAHQFGFPLFKFDVTKLFASKLGESEALVRDAIKVMESLGRAIILLDEIEKFFSTDATSGGGDSGVSSRMFGTLVSWMAMKTCPIFIVGTLNNFDRLPTELTRKGRFDEVFWVGLPSDAEKVAIFEALIKYKFKAKDFEGCVTPMLITATRDFSGAEIEAVIEEALYGLMKNPKAKGEDLLLSAADTIKPQAQLEPEKMQQLLTRAALFKNASLITSDKPVAMATRGKRNLTT